MLLLVFPELKSDSGPDAERLHAAGVEQAVINVWKELVAQEIKSADEEVEF
jgi:hypothetical protein